MFNDDDTFDEHTKYQFYAEDFEETLVGWSPDNLETWHDALEHTISNMTANEVRKVLSELNLDTSLSGCRGRLFDNYRSNPMRIEVLENWTGSWG